MKIQHITLLGMRGVPDATYDFTDPATGQPHDVVVITGPQASGKTRLLEAIAAAKETIGPYVGIASSAGWLAPGHTAAKVELRVSIDEEERAWLGVIKSAIDGAALFLPTHTVAEGDVELNALFGRYEHAPTHGKVEYFPATRRLPVFPPYHGLSTFEQRQYRCGKDPRKYSLVVRFLRGLSDSPARAKLFAARLEALSPTCRYIEMEPHDGLPRCLTSRGGEPRLMTELSDGEQDAVLFAATSTAIALDRSILLIDRPDLYVGPARLGSFIAGLKGLGQNQLFLTSESAELAAAAGPAHVIRLRED